MKEHTIRNDIQRISRTLSKERPYVTREDRNSLNNVIEYINSQNNEALRSNKIATKLIIHSVINKVIYADKTGAEAFQEIEQRIKQPIEAIFESMESHQPFIELDKILDNHQYRNLFEIKEVEYIFPNSEKREEHNKKIINETLEKLTKCFTGEKPEFRENIEKRVAELIAKYNH